MDVNIFGISILTQDLLFEVGIRKAHGIFGLIDPSFQGQLKKEERGKKKEEERRIYFNH